MEGYNHEEPFDEGYIQVSDIHKVYYTQYGKQDGKTVLFLHGGPGGSTSKANTKFFDPSIYRVVLVDQRGAGKSRPVAEVRENTTQLLIADIETLRTKLSVESWDIVFGGSWGSTLSLAYAQAHPMVVRALVLRGIFLGTNWEFDWTLRGGGASTLFPDRWADFVGYLPEDKRGDPMKAYHELLMSEDHATSLKAAWHWNRWELSVSTLTLAEDAYAKLDDEDWCLQHARIEVHYFVNANFLAGDKAILRSENVERIKNIPTYIVQGRYDVVCPPRAAWSLHQALPQSELHWTPNAGHSALEPGTKKKLTEICDKLAR